MIFDLLFRFILIEIEITYVFSCKDSYIIMIMILIEGLMGRYI